MSPHLKRGVQMEPSTSDKILAWLANHDCPEAREAAEWVDAYGIIMCTYAEYTGGYIDLNALREVLSEQCFARGIGEREELYAAEDGGKK